MRTKAGLLISALLAISVASCTAVEYIEVRPNCTIPPEPVLPAIDRGRLWEKVGDAEYRRIEQYIDRLWSYSDEQAAIISEACW